MAKKMAPGDATTKCKKHYGKIIATVKSSKDQSIIKRAKVTVKKAKGKPDELTISTNDEGQAFFVVGTGLYEASATADGKPKKQDPKRPFKPKDDLDAFTVQSKKDKPVDLVLDPVPMVRVFLKTVFTDPEGNERNFRGGAPTLEFKDGSTQKVVFKKGILVDADGKPGLDVLKEKKSFKLKFKKTKKPMCLSYEARGASKKRSSYRYARAEKAELPAKLQANRVFRIPHCDWGLDDSAKWTVSEDGGAYKTDTFVFDLENAGDEIGSKDAPVKCLLDPRWQFVRLTYYDRIIGGDDQISTVAMLLDGYALKPGNTPSADDLTTRSNWTIGDDDKTAIQCIPWILYNKDAEKPDKESQLRFTTKEHTFIKTGDDQKRTVVVGEQKTPNAERLRFYDLPKEWRSINWFVRTKPKGSDITDGKFMWELDTVEKVRGTKDKPLILSLDDIVLYSKADTPLAPLDKKEAVCVFHHSFKTGTDLSEHGLFLLEGDTPAPRHGQPVDETRFPVSKKEVLGRKSNDDPHTQLKENYVVKYPDWTRLVTAVGNVYECFAERSVAKTGEDRVVGARAAMSWFDATAQIDGVDPVPGKSIKRPKATVKPFCTFQPYVEMSNPVTRKRRDSGSSGTKGSATTATGLGPLLKSRVNRNPDRAKEYSSDQTAGYGIGRWDLCLLRCCGREGDDNKTETIVLFEYFRLGVEFISTGPTPTTLTTDTKKKTWVKTCVTNLLKRWNGPDGTSNAGRPSIGPQESETDKFSISILRFFQMNPRKHADFAFRVIAHKQGSRDWMNSGQGLSQTSEGNEKPQTSGWFTAAHEMGHGGGLLDDYIEKWNFASYYQPGIAMLVPGDPYSLDNVDGKESMMSGNHQLRPRHWWHIADWLHTMLPGNPKLHIKHGSGDPKPYLLPHHPRNSKTADKFRTYLQFPYDQILDAGLTLKVPKDDTTEDKLFKSRFDLYLWPLGEDAYSKKVLPGKSGAKAKTVDGIICVCVNIGFHYLGTTDHDWIRKTTANLVTLLQKTFSHRCVAKLTLGGHTLERCAIHVSPRVIVGTHAGNDGYDSEIGAVATTWNSGDGYGEGKFVDPGNGYWYEIIYNAQPGPGSSWRAETPVWPTTAGNTVNCPTWGKIKFKCWTKETAKTKAYQNVIEKLVEQNQLHVIVMVGTPSSELTSAAGELPRIKIKSGDLVDVIKAVRGFADAVKAVLQKVLPKRNEWKQKRDDLKDEVDQLDLDIQEAVNKKNEGETYRLAKMEERGRLGPSRTTENGTQWDALTRRAGRGETFRDNWENKRATRVTKRAEKHAEYLTAKANYEALRDFYKDQRQAQRIVLGLEQIKAMLAPLFTDTGDPMEDPFYRELVSAKNAAATASTQAKATRESVVKAIPEKWPQKTGSERWSVTKQLKLALAQLPQVVSTTPADVSNVAAAAINVAEKLQAFANSGSNASEKSARVEQAKIVIESCYDKSVAKRNWFLDPANKWVEDPDWPEVRVERHKKVLKRVCEVTMDWDAVAKSSTIEEQLQAHFAAYLGVEVSEASMAGYDRLVKPFASSAEVKLALPPKPPPKPPKPPEPPPDPKRPVEEPEKEESTTVSDPPSNPPSTPNESPDPNFEPN